MKNMKFILGFILGGLFFSGITVFAVTSIIGTDVFYDNKDTKLTSTDMQGAVNELYDKENYGNATAAQILSRKTALVGGSKVTGLIASKAAATYNVSSSDQTIASGKYLSEDQTISAVTTANISAANIKKGIVVTVGDAGSATRIKNVTGTYTTVSSGQTALTAAKLLTGYSGFANGGSEIKGSMVDNGAVTKSLSPGGSYTIPAGYHNGSGKVTATSNSETYTFATGSTGAKTDLGASNLYRYVDASNVYAKGKTDGATSFAAVVMGGGQDGSSPTGGLGTTNNTSYFTLSCPNATATATITVKVAGDYYVYFDTIRRGTNKVTPSLKQGSTAITSSGKRTITANTVFTITAGVADPSVAMVVIYKV